ncbi:MAG: anti-virulence regulator CigR family protein [Halomonas sp.]|uniref:anti-virulence regulator CigR family protein n=1 Tax=Halomonas sp. TaxID=1486246 RepID=UPI0028704A59|nr:anti-virulence regulator CigR family protein [Halomonas sp.]MDR9440427.1 anti-virulence regulator CigR family protein [Halomonas sp.]
MKTRFPLYPLVVAGVLGLTLTASPLLAQPGNGQGNSQGAAPWKEEGQQRRGQKGQSAQGSRGQGQGQDQGERDRRESRDRERYRDEARRPLIDEREVREIFRSRREVIRRDDRDSLPPGIRMNLERGKPLPPGIARNFDDRVRRDLPYYEGYEWRRVGTDAVLVDLTNDIIHEVIRDILR